MRARLLEQRDPVVDRKESRIMLLIIESHSNDQFVEQCTGALDDVQMPVGYWIKAPWIDGETHGCNQIVVLIPIRSC